MVRSEGTFRVRFTREADEDLVHLYEFILERGAADRELVGQALEAIRHAMAGLERSPFQRWQCRRRRGTQRHIIREALRLGQIRSELGLRLAAARLRDGALDEAAARIAPCLEGTEGGPRGGVFATEALAELARADWGGRLAPAAQVTLAAWATALAAATGAPAPSAQVDGAAERLTARELEVLARIAAGDSNKLIARAFDLSLHTVKRHVANIHGKLAVESRGQAAAWYGGESEVARCLTSTQCRGAGYLRRGKARCGVVD